MTTGGRYRRGAGLSTHLKASGTGLVVTIDELHAGDTNELRTLGIVVQEVTRVGRLPMAFIGAGLPTIEDTLLADTSITFLQRCARYEVGFLDPPAAVGRPGPAGEPAGGAGRWRRKQSSAPWACTAAGS